MAEIVMAGRALPFPTREDAPFWESCREHAMKLQRCGTCGRFWYYPSPICPHCSSREYEWRAVSGEGAVHTFTWVYKAAPGFEELAPYAYGLVELDEGPILATNIVEVDEGRLVVGLRTAVRYLDFEGGITLPLFRPIEEDADV